MGAQEDKDIWTAPGGTGNREWRVTPEDIRKAREDAIARGADRAELERQHAELVKHYGSEEALARAWTTQLWRQAYREQLGGSGRHS